MAVLALLGEIQLELLKNSPYKFRSQQRYSFVEHPRLEGSPTLQQVGGALQQLDLLIRLHAHLTDVDVELRRLRLAAETQEPLTFVVDDDYQGRYVITRFNEEPEAIQVNGDNSVEIISIDLAISLKEFIGVEPQNTNPPISGGFVSLANVA